MSYKQRRLPTSGWGIHGKTKHDKEARQSWLDDYEPEELRGSNEQVSIRKEASTRL